MQRRRVDITLRYTPTDLEVEVTDDGTGTDERHGARRGLAGIGERGAVFGGEYAVGPHVTGGLVAACPTAAGPMTRVVIADDQAVVRGGLRLILEAHHIEVVTEAPDGHAAVQAARELEPDVVVMDIRMPVLDGIEATRQRLSEPTRTKVLVLTTYGIDEYVY